MPPLSIADDARSASDFEPPDPLERAVLGFARMLLPGSAGDLESALEHLMASTSAEAVVLDRLVAEPERGLVLRPEAQVCRPGIGYHSPEFELHPELIQHESMLSGEIWVVDDCHADDAPDRETYVGLEPPIRSELAIPIFVDGAPAGLVSFVVSTTTHHWSNDEINALSAAATIIEAVWARQSHAVRFESVSEARRHSSRVAEALLACSQALLLDSGEQAVQSALQEVLDASSAAVVYLDENLHDVDLGESMRTRYSVVDASVPAGTFDWFGRVWSWAEMPHARSLLAKGESVVIETRADVHPDDALFYEPFSDVAAKLSAPVFVDGEWKATVGLLDLRQRRWMPEHRRLVETVAAMFGAYWTQQATEARLRSTLASRDEFVASVSHELRTPLAGVVGFASELRDAYSEFDEETRHELIRLIARQAGDVSYLVDDLLVAARSQQSSLSLLPSVIDLESEVKQTLAGLPPEYADGVEIESDGNQVAFADARRFRQIIRNLVVNARKYGGPSCVIRMHDGGRFAIIEVRDDGPGIPVSLRNAMFDAYRSGGHASDPLPSIGLGLTVSRQLADLMDGGLDYHFDGWSSFALRLPVRWSADIVEEHPGRPPDGVVEFGG